MGTLRLESCFRLKRTSSGYKSCRAVMTVSMMRLRSVAGRPRRPGTFSVTGAGAGTGASFATLRCRFLGVTSSAATGVASSTTGVVSSVATVTTGVSLTRLFRFGSHGSGNAFTSVLLRFNHFFILSLFLVVGIFSLHFYFTMNHSHCQEERFIKIC